MHNLFQHRLVDHWMQLTKYLRYVFNDFFVIALMFFVGALGLAYSNFLRGLTPHQWWQPIIIIAVLELGLQLGRLATLIMAPDRVFLAPQEGQLQGYFRQSFIYSLLMAGLMQAGVWFALLPFVSVSLDWNLIQLAMGFCLSLLLKWDWLSYQFWTLRNHQRLTWWRQPLFQWFLPLLIFSMGITVNLWVAFGLATGLLIISGWLIQKQVPPLNWQGIVAAEQLRILRIYRFFALFTDVPTVGPQPKRRAYLDRFFRRIPQNQHHLYTNLYVRTFFRDGETSSMYVRLLVVAAVILFFLDNSVVAVIVALTLLYLTGIQLRPFFTFFANNVFTRLYPVQTSDQVRNFRQFWQWLLVIELVLEVVVLLLGKAPISAAFISMVSGSVIIWWLMTRFVRKSQEQEGNNYRKETIK
ncbi:ABC transporter permease [Fructilactobacillus carniphilus]|uniref:ABC transporter permease n=1 Tax=Fructilactobacillus carniphilus TaxID=2940297 RepID=A0ABY5C030_9LACO|nr:ABC transporter permease [Fructilactobacillus carniphilus]USS91198.1 ABC transporter permease [Fructilactobacillus carniphilus]